MEFNQHKKEVLNRNNYIIIFNTSKLKYELNKVKILHAWWSYPSNPVLFCRLNNDWVVSESFLFSNIENLTQKFLSKRFQSQQLKPNYYEPVPKNKFELKRRDSLRQSMPLHHFKNFFR